MAEEINISVTDPISPAIERAKLMLFRPFDLGKWFAVGFCAWLASLGDGRFFQFIYKNSNSQDGQRDFHINISGREINNLGQLKTVITESWPGFLVFGAFAFVILLAVTVLILWLSSRGRFMFLYDVAKNEDKVSKPWSDYKTQGNSLFFFRLAVVVIASASAVMLSLFLAPMMLLARRSSNLWAVAGFAFNIAILAVIGLATILMLKFTKDFVVLIMYRDGVKCLEGWRRFRGLLFDYPGEFTLYILFQIVIYLAIVTLITAAVFLTCCCTASCFLAMPYIGTVVLLPILVFKRAYSIYYLRQFGDNFNVFYMPADPSGLIFQI